jgi:hypothetical protein
MMRGTFYRIHSQTVYRKNGKKHVLLEGEAS